ncbi:O-antigen ligase family protein [Paenibacillus piri]|uniref:O-antigen ligase domain-containing protein n=1 Tax=Paenibacillus piri TaxID=2547395 RepID=A0A4R5KWH0_9BACL|nr:O-antigen ligase family protein [Paenibacillus piri]TDG00147.1 O-antigen ligase domain-containing protein [Paenibacillus piri]
MARKVYGKQPAIDESVETEKKSMIFWLLIGFVLLFLFWAPFQKGLFNGNTFDFERPIYSSLVWSSIIFLLLSIHFFFHWKLRDHRDALSFLVLLIPFTYLISLFFAASHHYAINMLYIQMLNAVFFILGVYLCKNKLGFSLITGALIASGYVVVVFGLLNLLGNGKLAGALVGWFADTVNGAYVNAVMVDANGMRLTSVFQYANSYAAFLIAILLLASFYVVTSRKWYAIAVHALMTVPVIVSFWLTLSRGALVILPVVLLVVLFFLNLQRQIMLLLQLGLGFVASLAVLGIITDAATQLQQQYSASLSSQGWLSLLVASAVYTVIAVLLQLYIAPFIQRKLQRFEGRKFAPVVLPLAAIVVGLIGAVLLFSDTGLKNLLPSNIQTRLENINFAQHSVLERGTFYVDAIKLWKDYPVLGAGGGAWAALYEKYQNNPYVSRQAHNFFLQYLVETGIVGLLVFLAFIASIVYFFIKSYMKASQEQRDRYLIFFIVMISLLIHSAIDFDLSYVYLGMLLFLSLGGMLSFTEPVPLKLKSEHWGFHKTYPTVMLLLAIVMFFFSARLLSANHSFTAFINMLETNQNYDELAVPLNKAIELTPNHPDYVVGYFNGSSFIPGKASILDQLYTQTKNEPFFTESESLINALKRKEPHNRAVLMEQLTHYQMKGQLQQALSLVNSELPNYPWQIGLYEISISLSSDLGNQARQNGNRQEMDNYYNGALSLHQTVLNRMEELKSLPKEQNQGQEFNVTSKMAYALGQIYFNRGEFKQASDTLKPAISDQMDDPLNLATIRYYLASLSKQNQSDPALYDKLIAKDPNEKQQIEALVSSANASPAK